MSRALSCHEVEQAPLVGQGGAGWGSIHDEVNGPLINVRADTSWLSILLMWLLLPLNLAQGLVAGLCSGVMVCFTVGCRCCPGSCCSTYRSVMEGRPFYLAFNWWRYCLAMVLALVMSAGRSRIGLFSWERDAFKKSRFFWHGEGIWCWSYKDCDSILRSKQKRTTSFFCVTGCVPDLIPAGCLIFLSNDDSDAGLEWNAIRQAFHSILDKGTASYKRRLEQLAQRVGDDWPRPKLKDFDDLTKVQKTVSKCIFFMLFGIWVTDDEADMLKGWRDDALSFILPRMLHRFLFNFLIRKLKKLRVDTVRLLESYGLQQVFIDMNNNLPERFRRTPAVKLCDEITFIIGFAGIGGTSACIESVGAFLQAKKPDESHHIDFGRYKTSEEMVHAYLEDPEAYIKETCRLDPPVTSATRVLHEEKHVDLAGSTYYCPAGTLNQYVLGLGNRDPEVWAKPNVFNPKRKNLNQALTWHGAWGVKDYKALYPRICPGRYLALHVARAIIDHVVQGSRSAS